MTIRPGTTHLAGRQPQNRTGRRLATGQRFATGVSTPGDCLNQACTIPIVTARPSLKELTKGLDVFWQRAVSGLADATPGYRLTKYTPLTTPVAKLSRQVSRSTEPSTKEQKQTSSQLPSTTASLSPSLLDSARGSGVLSVLLVDDQDVSWINPTTDVRYTVGVKICALRDSQHSPQESKGSLPLLLQEIRRTLVESDIEALLWVGEPGEDPGVPFADIAGYLWQAPQWQAYRPGDPAPAAAFL